MNSPNKFSFFINASIFFMGVVSLITILYFAQSIIVPLIYGIIISISLNPIVDFFARRKMNRILAISITMILILFLFTLVLGVLFSQVSKFSDALPELRIKFNDFTKELEHWVSRNFNLKSYKSHLLIEDIKSDISADFKPFLGRTLMNLGNVLIYLFLIPVYVFMILFYKAFLIEFVYKIFRLNSHKMVNDVLTATKKIIQSYLSGLLLEALIIAILNTGCLFLIGTPYAILIGVIGAILNVIPYIGGVVAVALPMVVALVTQSPTHAFLVLFFYLLIQFVDNNIIVPKLIGSKVQLNALVTMVAIIIGGALWGIPGMFLSIPLTAIAKVIFDSIDSLKPYGFLLGNILIFKKRKYNES